MHPKTSNFIDLWSNLAKQLNIEICTLFTIGSNGKTITYPIMIPYFGCEVAQRGLVVDLIREPYESPVERWDLAWTHGYTACDKNPDNMDITINEFQEFLDMYQWYGLLEQRPSWHTGKYHNSLI